MSHVITLQLASLTGSFQYLTATGGAGRFAHIGSSPESIACRCVSKHVLSKSWLISKSSTLHCTCALEHWLSQLCEYYYNFYSQSIVYYSHDIYLLFLISCLLITFIMTTFIVMTFIMTTTIHNLHNIPYILVTLPEASYECSSKKTQWLMT